jgi:hypothetical protein
LATTQADSAATAPGDLGDRGGDGAGDGQTGRRIAVAQQRASNDRHPAAPADPRPRRRRHAGTLTLRLPPGHHLLDEILARIRALPATS